ncbi:MAG: dihydroneopterin aldolase [Sphaerochaeta sp.]
MDKVFIKNLVARGIIGLNDWEREKEQEILINATLYCDTREAAKSDSLEGSVNYRSIAKALLAHAQGAKRFTVEALAHDFVALCFADPFVQRVVIRVEKPGAVRFSESVGVEIDRKRGQ